MQTHTHEESTAQLLPFKNHQVCVLLHIYHLDKAHVDSLGCPNASLVHPKLSYLHLTQNQDHPVCPPTIEPNKFSSPPKCSRIIIVSFSSPPSSQSSQYAPCWGLAPRLCTKCFLISWTAWLYYKLCGHVQLLEITHVPWLKSTISTL